jgi:anaerobic selenocysteine-containing dehydrogenase
MDLFPAKLSFLQFIAKIHSRLPSFALFPIALKLYLSLFPKLKKSILIVLYETIGKTLKDGAKNAAMLWAVSHLYAKKYRKAVLRTGLKGKGFKLGEALFSKILESKSGLEISNHKFEEVWELLKTKDKKIHLHIPEMITALNNLKTEQLKTDDFPFILAAGERRLYNANQIYRDPNWRKKDMEGALRIHSDDAIKIGILNDDYALVKSEKHQIKVKIEYDNAMNLGFVSLPHGYGFDYVDEENPTMIKQNGPKINMLTSSENCDPITKTPYHKYVPVSIERI